MADSYPAWFQAFLDAPTDRLPGYFGDWFGGCVDSHVEETGASLTFFSRDHRRAAWTPEATFYGTQESRRRSLCRWLYEVSMASVIAEAVEAHEDFLDKALLNAELPLRLMFSQEYADRLFGKEWE